MSKARKIDLIRMDQPDWTVLRAVDAVVIQRAVLPHHLPLCQQCADWRLPLWIDEDDALDIIQPDNLSRRFYEQPQVLIRWKQCLALADLVTFSTVALAERYAQECRRMKILRNALDLDVLKRGVVEDRNPVVVWRGGKSHDRDIDAHADAIRAAYRDFPRYQWLWIGDPPWHVVGSLEGNRAAVLPWNPSYPGYMEGLRKLKPAIAIVPLSDNLFNDCKSDCSFLEASYAGAASLVPSWLEFARPGAVTYSGPEQFRSGLYDMLGSDLRELQKLAAVSWDYVKKERSLEVANEQRLRYLHELLAEGR